VTHGRGSKHWKNSVSRTTGDDLFFFVKPAGDKDVQLFIDEVTLFDAGNAAK
jgi:hypothetical protein